MKVTPEELEKYLNGKDESKPDGKPAGGGTSSGADAEAPAAKQDVQEESGAALSVKGRDGGGAAAVSEGAAGEPPALTEGQKMRSGEPSLWDDLAGDELFAVELENELAALPEMRVFRVTINHEGGVFEYPDGRYAANLEGFLVKWVNRRVRWSDGRIACLSRDGEAGRLIDGTLVYCGQCVHSGTCGFSPRLYFVPPTRARELFYFDVPSGQSSVFYGYVNKVAGKKSVRPSRPLSSVVTRVRLEKREGWRAARLSFEAVRPVDRKEWREVLALRDELLPYALEEGGGNAGEAAAGPSLEDVVF